MSLLLSFFSSFFFLSSGCDKKKTNNEQTTSAKKAFNPPYTSRFIPEEIRARIPARKEAETMKNCCLPAHFQGSY